MRKIFTVLSLCLILVAQVRADEPASTPHQVGKAATDGSSAAKKQTWQNWLLAGGITAITVTTLILTSSSSHHHHHHGHSHAHNQ